MDEALWIPQPGPQADAIAADWCEELFFGGARGGGKTSYLLGDFLKDVDKYGPNWHGLLTRRFSQELEEIERQSYEMYAPAGAEYKASKKTWIFPQGSTLKLRYVEEERDAAKYQGHQYTWIARDELPIDKSLSIFKMLKGCLRWTKAEVPTKRIRATGNPGGNCHGEVKDRFIDPAPLGYELIRDELPNGRFAERMFIPSSVEDNAILMMSDPGYIDRLYQVGSKSLVDAWLKGDWNAVLGAYFNTFSLRHVIEPFNIPASWMKFRAIDWGSYNPFCVLWIAISTGACVVCGGSSYCYSQGRRCWNPYPRESAIVYREWYGEKEQRLYAEEFADGINARTEPNEKIDYTIIDPAAFQKDGGDSIADRMAAKGVICYPGDNRRLAGWDQVRARLGREDSKPMLYIMKNCKNLIRTFPLMQHDRLRPEDLDSGGEDHALDALRYGLMSRPYVIDESAPLGKTLIQPSVDDQGKLNKPMKDLLDSHFRYAKRVHRR